MPDASSTPQDVPLRLNLTDAVSVSCEIEMVVITIQKHFLQQEAIPEASLYLGEPSCNVSRSNGTHVFLVTGWGQCGTLVQSVSAPGCEPPEGTSVWGGFAPGRETGGLFTRGPLTSKPGTLIEEVRQAHTVTVGTLES